MVLSSLKPIGLFSRRYPDAPRCRGFSNRSPADHSLLSHHGTLLTCAVSSRLSWSHQRVRGLPHPLGVLHLQTNLVLPSLLITRQRSLLFKVTDCRLSGQPPCDHGCLYPAPVCWHDHASSVADRHHPIRVGPREGSINREAIPYQRRLLSSPQSLSRYLVLLDEAS